MDKKLLLTEIYFERKTDNCQYHSVFPKPEEIGELIDLELEFTLAGYDSPTSFTKAFQLFHGVTPKEARSGNAKLRIVPKMQISEKQQYSWRLEEKPAFRLIGKSMWCVDGEQHTKIPEFWSDCQRDGTFSRLIDMDIGNPKGLFGLFHYEELHAVKRKYSIMVTAAEGDLPDGCRGAVPQAIQNGWRYLQEEWILRYPFRHATCPELEWYSSSNAYDSDYLSQIWIPVVVDKNN